MTDPKAWYIVKQKNGQCAILPASQMAPAESGDAAVSPPEQWGPFASEAEAIARRVGLIRAGKCQPV